MPQAIETAPFCWCFSRMVAPQIRDVSGLVLVANVADREGFEPSVPD